MEQKSLEALIERLHAHSRRQRQSAAQGIYEGIKDDPKEILPYLNQLRMRLAILRRRPAGRSLISLRWWPRSSPTRWNRHWSQRRTRFSMRRVLRLDSQPSVSLQCMGQQVKNVPILCGLSWMKPCNATMGMLNIGTCSSHCSIWQRAPSQQRLLKS